MLYTGLRSHSYIIENSSFLKEIKQDKYSLLNVHQDLLAGVKSQTRGTTLNNHLLVIYLKNF